MTATIQLILPTDKPYNYSPLFAKQGDYNSRYYAVTLQSEGKSVSIGDDATVLFNVKRASDGKSKVFEGTAEDGKAICPLPAFATEVGNTSVSCSVSVTDGESRFTTSKFVVFIQSAESTDTDITEDENYDVLVSLLNSINSALGHLDDATGVIVGVDGKSAYEIAVANGYDGTEEDWLASLKGDTGADGKDGTDGVGIVSIAKTATDGIEDTYTITLTDGTAYDFKTANAENMQSSIVTEVKSVIPEDLIIDEDDNKIYLTINGVKTGAGVTLPVSGAVALAAVTNESTGEVTITLLDKDGNELDGGACTFSAGSGKAVGLDYEMVTDADGNEQVRLWLVDKNGEEIEGSSVQFSGGGGGGSSTSYVTRLFNSSNSLSMQLATGQDCVIKFYFKEMYGTEQTTAKGDVVYSYSHDGSTYTQIATDNIAQDTVTEFDLTDYLVSGANYLKVTVTGGEGQVSKTLTYSVTLVDCYMVSSFNQYQVYTGNFSLQYSCVGRSLDKTVYIEVDGGVAYTNAYGTGSSNTGLVAAQTISTSGWEHGVHTLEMYFITTTGVESPHLTYDVMFSTEEETPILSASFGYDEVTYGDIQSVYYSVYTANNGDTTDEVTRRIYYLDSEGNEVEIASYTDTDVSNNAMQEWSINFSTEDMPTSGTIYIELSVTGGNSKTFEVKNNAFTSDYNVATVSRRLIAYIAPTGQSNSESNATALSETYIDNNEVETTITAEMENFNYSSNGYVTDDDGNYCLRMSGDARLKIYLPLFETNYADDNGNTVRFNGSVQSVGRTAEFRFKVSKVTDSVTPVISCFTATEETSEQLQGAGFRILPQSAYIMCNGQALSFDNDGNVKNPQDIAVANFCTDEIVRLSFVVEGADGSATGKQAIKIYLNGELTRIVSYDTTSTFTTPSYIEFGSNGCILDLYSCDFYDTYLSDNEIMQNSFTDLSLFADRVAKFEENDVDNDSANGRGFYNSLYPTTYVNNDDMLDYYACRTRIPCILTTGTMSPEKGTKTNVGIIFTKPADNEDGYVIEFESMEQIDGSYINQTNVQGTTSSQLYPRFNYKLTFYDKKETTADDGTVSYTKKKHKYILKEGSSIGESTLCWKADAMSPDHANTVNAVYFEDMFTEKIPPAQENSDVHPIIYGYRCLLFNRANADDTTPINFMGDGCLNNDKSNNATFGLSNDCDTDETDAYWTDSGTEVTAVVVDDETVAVANAEGDVETKCQKWEFLDNSQAICSFQTDNLLDGGTAENSAVYEALESSYPDQGDLEDYGLLPNYGHIQILYTWLLKRANFWTETEETARAEKKAIFEAEFTKHVNLQHALSYFIAVRVTALIDNYAKNMFMSCYDTCADNIVFTSTAQAAGVTSMHTMMEYAKTNGGDIPEDFIDWDNSEFAIWYPTMYDLDSCYGVDNKGYRWIPYYADWDYYKWNDEEQGYIMNGSQSYFWRMFYEVFYSSIKSKFNELANTTSVTLSDGTTATVLSLANWTDKMITTNIETVPIRITTEDSIYKYVMPWLYGYVKGANYSQYAETPEFLYLVQSNKELQDKDFMTRRLNLLYSEFESNFYTGDALTILLPASDFTADDVTLTLTPSQVLYCKVRYDTNASFTGTYAEEGQAVEIPAPEADSYSEATITIAGASLLSYIDGLQKLKGTSYNLGNATKLRALIIGSTDSDYINSTTTSLTVSACEMLEELNIAHLTSLQSIDLSNCALLKTVEARGCSALSSITFPVGGYLETVHLPAMSTLILRRHENITDFSMTTWDSDTDTYTADYSSLTTLYLEGNMSAIPLGKILLETGGNLKGLRLVDVSIDLSEMAEADALALIEILADDTLYGKQIDSTGVQVAADADVESTWYPIISGTLTIGDHEIDDDHDLMLVKIMERYPSLVIAPPETTEGYKSLNKCKYYEIKAVITAAENGTLTNNGTPCGLQYDSSTKLGWWEVGDYKDVTTTYDGADIAVRLQIGGFYKDTAPDGTKIPVTLIMKNASEITTRAMNSSSKYYYGYMVDGTAHSYDDGTSASLTYTNEGEERDIEIVFTQSSFINYITVESNGTTATYYFTGARSNYYNAETNPEGVTEGEPTDENYFSQEDVLGDSYAEQQSEVALTSSMSWSGGQRITLTIDGTDGPIYIYNKNILSSDSNSCRNIEFTVGSRIIIHNVGEGGTVKIVPRATLGFGGYWNSELHTWVEETLYNTFPEVLRRILKTARINASVGGLTTHTTESRDVKIALLSCNDAGANSSLAINVLETAQEDAYPLFTGNASRIKYSGDDGETAVNWWILSPSYSGNSHFYGVNTSGGINNYSYIPSSYGVVCRLFL